MGRVFLVVIVGWIVSVCFVSSAVVSFYLVKSLGEPRHEVLDPEGFSFY